MIDTIEIKYKAMTASRNHYKARCDELERHQMRTYAELLRIKQMSFWELVKMKWGMK